MDLSIVIPLVNERESLAPLVEWLHRVMGNMKAPDTVTGLAYEVILVDDGSTDGSWKEIQRLSKEDGRVKGIRFGRNYGKSPALNEGFRAAEGKVVITMDADLQDDPDEIPELYRMITMEGFDLVSGWKKKRYDPITKTLPTKLFNWTTRRISGVHLHDFNCGLKAYKQDVVKNIEVFGEMHRYIPFIAKKEGFRKIGEKVVKHHPRKFGATKFGFDRFINGFLDLLTITYIFRFGKKPMHFFGGLGSFMFVVGFFSATWVIGEKLWFSFILHQPAPRVAESGLFFVALTAMVIGVQLFTAGFVADLVSRNGTERNRYRISDRTGF
ncbi:MAG: glycosyltransferase family 2 protein [Flavobacteriales bacterium]|nr:glycosyltransferase family 2 protein [Flavobacteriales bacterium]MBK7100427.1 glycosyltransferase family 2 protein [Flavobacteriales bacterium]MCC6910446.1 glycosyltransferase family 2 protein [Flavobacteriales bacterium]HQW06219.1 glycosyltransferase family 2 protein [Flavobacteriales bacterium]